jgi:hypothetical protein
MRTRFAPRAMIAVILAFSPVVGLVPVQEAHASAVVPLSDEQLTDAATWVVRGTVTDVWTEADDETGLIWTRARLVLAHVYKGPGDPSELIVDTLGGTVGDRTLLVDDVPRWSPGEDVLVFLDVVRGGRLSTLALAHGKYTIRRAPGETRPHVVRMTLPLDQVWDARFLPHPPPDQRVYLDQVEDHVRTRLITGWDGQPIPGMSPDRLQQVNSPEYRRVR